MAEEYQKDQWQFFALRLVYSLPSERLAARREAPHR